MSTIEGFRDFFEKGVDLQVGLFMNEARQCGPHAREGRPKSQSTGMIDMGVWHARFAELPLVIMAEHEGWGRELRGYVRKQLRRLAHAGQPFDDPRAYMPKDQKWISNHRKQAAITKRAQEWQKENLKPHDNRI